MISWITSVDSSVLSFLFALRDPSAVAMNIGLSELGSTVVVCGLVLCGVLFLAFRRNYWYAAGLLVSVLGGGATALLIKELAHRARPDRAFQAYVETGYSFPSGHATLAAAFYGFLAYTAWRLIPAGTWRAIAVGCLGVLILAIGFTRLYLGVHYLSDVLGGFVVGGIFALIGIAIAKKYGAYNLSRARDGSTGD